MGFPGGAIVKNSPANAGDVGSFPGQRRSPEEGNGNLPPNLPAWEIPWTEKSGRSQTMGSQKNQT